MFSFGLGSGCDVRLVTEVARAGRGASTIVQDGAADLNGQVVRALSMAMEPSLCDTKYGFNGELSEDSELFRNSLCADAAIIDAALLDELKFTFSTKEAESREALNLEFNRVDFSEVQGEAAQALFKMAAHRKIEKSKDPAARKSLSVKYQVVCDDTAIVGVLKQTDKTSGELRESNI